MAIIRGLTGIAEKQKQDKERGFNPNMYLLIRDGQIARIRFITDGQDIVAANYHTYPTGKRSQSGKPIFESAYCGADDGEDCEFCVKFGKPEASRRRMMNLYVWVYDITDPNNPVDEVKQINQVRVLKTGGGKNGSILAQFQSFFRKYTTLCDRGYDWIRSGSGADDTTYNLLPDDKTPAPHEIQLAAKNLPSLEDVAKGLAFINTEIQPARREFTSQQVIPPKSADDEPLFPTDEVEEPPDDVKEVSVPSRRGRPQKAPIASTTNDMVHVQTTTSVQTPPSSGGKTLLQRLREREEQHRQQQELGKDL